MQSFMLLELGSSAAARAGIGENMLRHIGTWRNVNSTAASKMEEMLLGTQGFICTLSMNREHYPLARASRSNDILHYWLKRTHRCWWCTFPYALPPS